jgi:hypothetical protein
MDMVVEAAKLPAPELVVLAAAEAPLSGLVVKNVYRLTTNIYGPVVGGNVDEPGRLRSAGSPYRLPAEPV